MNKIMNIWDWVADMIQEERGMRMHPSAKSA